MQEHPYNAALDWAAQRLILDIAANPPRLGLLRDNRTIDWLEKSGAPRTSGRRSRIRQPFKSHRARL